MTDVTKYTPDEIRYKCYIIERNVKPIPLRDYDWDYVHEDYDGPEDGRSGSCASIDDCKRAIDEEEGPDGAMSNMKCANAIKGEEGGVELLHLPCLDPDNCDGDITDTRLEPPHHYGCDCEECVAYYRSLK